MVSEEKFKELLELKKKLKADAPHISDEVSEQFYRTLSSTRNLTHDQFRELLKWTRMTGEVAYEVYALNQWVMEEEERRQRFIERIKKVKRKGKKVPKKQWSRW